MFAAMAPPTQITAASTCTNFSPVYASTTPNTRTPISAQLGILPGPHGFRPPARRRRAGGGLEHRAQLPCDLAEELLAGSSAPSALPTCRSGGLFAGRGRRPWRGRVSLRGPG